MASQFRSVVPQTVRVEGLRELLRVTDQLPTQIRRDIRNEIRQVAEPVRAEAETLIRAYLTVHSKGRRYNAAKHARYGISVRKVGTVSVEERIKSKYRGKRKRPKFIDLQFKEGLDPAVEHNEHVVMAGFNRVLDNLERRWAVG